jgi:transcriptional regulator with XRE-family HTH domain
VTSGLPGEPGPQRTQLGAELRRVRMLAGLSGRQLAQAAGFSQSAVSRAERGESVLSLPEVTAWADAAGVPGDRRAVLLALAEAAVNEVATFRVRLASGLAAAQAAVGDLEASARVVRNFQPGIIPGLLQTADYARRILALADTSQDGSLAAAVAARLARQQALHDPARTFEFVITEAALRYRPGAPDILALPDGGWPVAALTQQALTGQLDHLAAVVTAQTITFGVIPADAEMHAITRCGFILYEDRTGGQPPVVVIETPHAALHASDPADIALYRDQLARLRQSAVYGADALHIVRSIAHP